MGGTRAVGCIVHWNRSAGAVSGLVIEGATVTWRVATHVAIIPHHGARRGKVDATRGWRVLEIHECTATARIDSARAARGRVLDGTEMHAGALAYVSPSAPLVYGSPANIPRYAQSRQPGEGRARVRKGGGDLKRIGTVRE